MDAEELVDAAVALKRPDGGRVLLGVAGAPGAGKSTLARFLVRRAEARLGPGTAAYVPMDGFHLSNAQLERLGLTDRKGSAPSFDVWGYVALLERLRASRPDEPVYVPDFDRTLDEPVAARHLVAPTVRLVVTEGNYLGSAEPGWRRIRPLLDRLWYLETPDAVRELRLIDRQLTGGRDDSAARAWVERNDMPNGEAVRATRTDCDRVVTVEGRLSE